MISKELYSIPEENFVIDVESPHSPLPNADLNKRSCFYKSLCPSYSGQNLIVFVGQSIVYTSA